LRKRLGDIERNSEINARSVDFDPDNLPETGAHLTKKKARSPQSQLENKQKIIILALLIKGNWTKTDSTVLATDLCKILALKAGEEGDEGLKIGAGTVEDRIGEAKALLKKL
jgi:hypothetical protein